jgi:aromatic ring-opening dioxygenase catalytic subunit (LigB family)
LISRLPTYFISHGGGPWPYIEELRSELSVLRRSLEDIPRQIGVAPTAVLVVSGHWEEREFTVMASAKPPMIYDYSGFPEHTYHVKYEAPGSPELARKVQALIKSAGMAAELNPERGFDHGAFTPLAVIYPAAQVPVVQLSLKSGYDPAAHFAAGQALTSLRDEGVLIIGSGLSYHNLRCFGPPAKRVSKTFDDWLQETLLDSDPDARTTRLLDWSAAPAAREAHPQEDHLIPLMVAVGAAARDKATVIYHEENLLGGVTASSFRFGRSASPRNFEAGTFLHEHHVHAEKAAHDKR